MHDLGFAEPLRVGDLVSYDGYYSRKPGTVVERLSEDYVRVLWEDACCPTTHRDSSLMVLYKAPPQRH
jgi:hypothetical protein